MERENGYTPPEAQVVDPVVELPPLTGGEVVLFEAPKPKSIVKSPNQVNHENNKKILHGAFYKGTYFHHGIGQPHSPSKKNGGRH